MHTTSMPSQGSQVLVRIGIPHTNGPIITTREELVAVEGETCHTTSMPFQGSQVLVRIGIPHTNGPIITTREELVTVEGETPHTTSMPFKPIQALAGTEEEALEHTLHGALVQRVVLPLLLVMQLLLLADPQQQVSLPQSQLALHSA